MGEAESIDTLKLADEIADGMRKRVVETIQRANQSMCGVVFSTADVLWLLDAYDELRGRNTSNTQQGPIG